MSTLPCTPKCSLVCVLFTDLGVRDCIAISWEGVEGEEY